MIIVVEVSTPFGSSSTVLDEPQIDKSECEFLPSYATLLKGDLKLFGTNVSDEMFSNYIRSWLPEIWQSDW